MSVGHCVFVSRKKLIKMGFSHNDFQESYPDNFLFYYYDCAYTFLFAL